MLSSNSDFANHTAIRRPHTHMSMWLADGRVAVTGQIRSSHPPHCSPTPTVREAISDRRRSMRVLLRIISKLPTLLPIQLRTPRIPGTAVHPVGESVVAIHRPQSGPRQRR